MPDTIKFELNSWRENAGIVGLVDMFPDDVIIHDDYIELPTRCLNHFSERYFERLSYWYKPLSKINGILEFQQLWNQCKHENEFREITKEQRSAIQKFNKNYLSNSHFYTASAKKVYNKSENGEQLVDQLKLAKTKLKDYIHDKEYRDNPEAAHRQLMETDKTMQAIFDYFNNEYNQKLYVAYNLSNRIIQAVWYEFAMLSNAYFTGNAIEDFQHAAVDTVKEVLKHENEHENETPKAYCAFCDRPLYTNEKINNVPINGPINKYGGIGEDYAKKVSHIWNNGPKPLSCPMCRLLYLTMPLGLTFGPNKGDYATAIFVNYNHTVNNLVKANRQLQNQQAKMLAENHELTDTYRVMFDAHYANERNTYKYALANVQVIRFEEQKPHDDTVSTQAAQIFNAITKNSEQHNYLSALGNSGIKDYRGDGYLRLYDEAIKHITLNYDLDNLITMLIKIYISKSQNDKNVLYNPITIFNLININRIIKQQNHQQRGMNPMKITAKDLNSLSYQGSKLRRTHLNNNYSENSLKSRIIRLDHALNDDNINDFMYTLRNLLEANNEYVPQALITNMSDLDNFKLLASAYVSGLCGTTASLKKSNND